MTGKCRHCNKDIDNNLSCSVGGIMACIRCAYDNFPDGSPAKKQLEKHYKLEGA